MYSRIRIEKLWIRHARAWFIGHLNTSKTHFDFIMSHTWNLVPDHTIYEIWCWYKVQGTTNCWIVACGWKALCQPNPLICVRIGPATHVMTRFRRGHYIYEHNSSHSVQSIWMEKLSSPLNTFSNSFLKGRPCKKNGWNWYYHTTLRT